MIGILYPSGSHGMFLEMLLNLFSGITVKTYPITNNVHVIYDHVSYEQSKIFTAAHFKKSLPECTGIINIRVPPQSYMKYIAVCLNRTSGVNIVLEELDHDTFNKIKCHPIFSHFFLSLKTISRSESGDVELKYLREWARLCFFADKNSTIEKFINTSIDTSADYILDYECFYSNDALLEQCEIILDKFNLPMYPVENIQEHLTIFAQNNRYKNIDKDIDLITQAIIDRQNYEFDSENFIKQAWIDNWLVSMYNVDIKLENSYWANTKEIIEAYDL